MCLRDQRIQDIMLNFDVYFFGSLLAGKWAWPPRAHIRVYTLWPLMFALMFVIVRYIGIIFVNFRGESSNPLHNFTSLLSKGIIVLIRFPFTYIPLKYLQPQESLQSLSAFINTPINSFWRTIHYLKWYNLRVTSCRLSFFTFFNNVKGSGPFVVEFSFVITNKLRFKRVFKVH